MTDIGSQQNPLRIAVFGAGPSGFYATESLTKQKDIQVQVDLFDRLPSPYGLVRGGVAPDHDKIKSVTKVYDRIAKQENVHYYGNVEFGVDICVEDLPNYYHAAIFTVGAQSDKSLGIAGEDLPGSHAATEFVGWYNAHPDYRDYEFDLNVKAAAIIGVGNVAMDVARILGRSQNELAQTDIADYALEALAHSQIETIYVIGRRGPAQAAFTNPEIKELGEMEDVDLIISPEEITLGKLTEDFLKSGQADRKDIRNVEIMQAFSLRPPAGKPKQIVMRFLESPVEIVGEDRVEAIRLVKNELYQTESGELRPRPTTIIEELPVGLVFRSVGYRGVPLTGLPFYDKWGIIPNIEGRVVDVFGSNHTLTGLYVAGWIKRGPSGVIGTNKPDSVETAQHVLEDAKAGNVWQPINPSVEAAEAFIRSRKPNCVNFEDWERISQMEQQHGAEQGRPRVKFSCVADMLDVLKVPTTS
ncbi:FAD-dependent oxidoreductase [Anaerolineales bacterium]